VAKLFIDRFITIIGFFINKNKIGKYSLGSLAGAVYFFLISILWFGSGKFGHK
jgi:hypothetical protein